VIIEFGSAESPTLTAFDLCIIGAGAAGITLAREFIGSTTRVCLLESGGLEYSADVQKLAEGKIVGFPYFDLAAIRLRFLGGTTNHWEGMCSTFSSIDFEARPWVPYSGWPITRMDLDPYYLRAQVICQLGPYQYESELWKELGLADPGFTPTRLNTRFSQFSPPTRFGEVYREELDRASNITVVLNANVINIQPTEQGNHVTHVDLRSLTGNADRVRAKNFVLCCGCIENARILLASNTVMSGGLGNDKDLVGRFFMEHPQVRCGIIASDKEYDLLDRYNRNSVNGVQYKPGIVASDLFQREQQILNCSAGIDHETDPEDGTRAAIRILNGLKHYRMSGKVPEDLFEAVWRVIRNLDDVGYNAYRHYVLGTGVVSPIKKLFLVVRSEQAPNRDSRVFLGEERDALGMKKIRLDWRLTELDKLSIRKLTEVIGLEFGKQNLGRVRMEEWLRTDDNEWPDFGWGDGMMTGQYHHMGTTRMAHDPSSGVVDRNCRVHGISNLYIAGSSVFPTSGYANPTLTVVALALRLADHLNLPVA